MSDDDRVEPVPAATPAHAHMRRLAAHLAQRSSAVGESHD